MTLIRAIDPGSDETAWVLYDPDDDRVLAHAIEPNETVLQGLGGGVHGTDVVIEWMTPRGMPTSAQEFETLWWIGRFTERAMRAGATVHRLPRGKVKDHVCGNRRANDSNIRAALIDRYGGTGGKAEAVGVKARPGPLYGIAADEWAALGVAVTYADEPSFVYTPKGGRS